MVCGGVARAFYDGPHDAPKSIIPEHQRPAHICYTVPFVQPIDLGTYGASPPGKKPLWLARCRAMLCNAGECGKIQRRPRAYAIPLTQVPVGPILVLQARCGLVLLLAYSPLPDTTCSPTIQCLMAHIGWTPPACFPRDMLLWLAKLWIPSNRHARDCFRRRATLGRIRDEVGGGSCFRVAAKIAIETA
jgi:hypothetical protein